MVNTKLLKARMKEVGISQEKVAAELSLARPTVSQKLRNVRPMFLDEAEKLSNILGIAPSDFGTYFFVNEVAQSNNGGAAGGF